MSILDSTQSFLTAREQARGDILQQKENESREAFNAFTVVTSGVGDITPMQPIMFDARFIEEPTITTGVAIVKLPDLTRYRLPLVTAGVLRWVTEPLRPKESTNPGSFADLTTNPEFGTSLLDVPDPKHPKAWIGAYMYFTVFVDPIKRPRTDGSNKDALVAELGSTPGGSIAHTNLVQLVKEANEAIDLLTHLPKTTLRHTCVFRGVAQKKLHESVTDLSKMRTTLDPS